MMDNNTAEQEEDLKLLLLMEQADRNDTVDREKVMQILDC